MAAPQVTYFALCSFDDYAVGDLIPNAVNWPFISGYVKEGKVAPVLVATLPQDVQDQLESWEDARVAALAPTHEEVVEAQEEAADAEADRVAAEAAAVIAQEAADKAAEAEKEAKKAAKAAEKEAAALAKAEAEAEIEALAEKSYADLKAEADSLGLEYKGNISGDDLRSLIEAKLSEAK